MRTGLVFQNQPWLLRCPATATFHVDREIQTAHSLGQFTDAASDYLDWVYADHIALQAVDISKYYGNRKPEHQTTELRTAQLTKFGKPAFLADQQMATVCVTLAMQAMERGFTGMPKTWRTINDQMRIEQNFYGTDLQIMLKQLSWKVYYWNPDPSKIADWDAEDKKLNPPKDGGKWRPEWASHALRYASVVDILLQVSSIEKRARPLLRSSRMPH
jgi:hypothetical protein